MIYFKSIGLIVTFSVVANGKPIRLTYDDNVYVLDGNYSSADQQTEYTEMGDFFEGDMVLTHDQQQAIYNSIKNRNGLTSESKRWPEKSVVYHIVKDDFDEEEVKLIEKGMADIANKSCIRFRARKDKREHAVIIQGSKSGCFSNVGVTGSDDDRDEPQVLNLAKGCFKHGIVVHEMLHTLGFYHMQSTYNRDDFVKIIWENVAEGRQYNFAKYTNSTVSDYGVPYDYGSVMHYSAKAFSKNGEKTIIPLKANATIGQRDGMSESDLIKLNKMYCEN